MSSMYPLGTPCGDKESTCDDVSPSVDMVLYLVPSTHRSQCPFVQGEIYELIDTLTHTHSLQTAKTFPRVH